MLLPLACPHCQAVLPPDPPGVLHCGRCGDAYTILGPDEVARQRQKIRDERNILMGVGGVMFLVYVAPVLLTMAYLLFVVVVYLMIFLGLAIGGAVG